MMFNIESLFSDIDHKIDLKMVLLSVLLLLFITWDVHLTYIGLSMGYEEGNRYIADLMEQFGVVGGLLIVYLILIFMCVYMIIIRQIWYTKPNQIFIIYSIMMFCIFVRVFIVGAWVGVIAI